MVLVQEKKGESYTKDERIKRQNEVHRLHFEYGYSAIKISEMITVSNSKVFINS